MTTSVLDDLLDCFIQPNAERIAKLAERNEIAVCVAEPRAGERCGRSGWTAARLPAYRRECMSPSS